MSMGYPGPSLPSYETGSPEMLYPGPHPHFVDPGYRAPVAGQAPRKRVNVARNSKGYSVECTVETYGGESTADIMAMVEELQTALEAKYPREA